MPVREATPDDAAALLPLYRAYCDFYSSHPPDEGLARVIRAFIEEPRDRAFLLVASVEDGGPIVGFAGSAWKWSSLRGGRIVFLEDLYLDPEARGRGLAEELIEEVARVAREGGAPIVAWSTGPDNRRAQAVYDRIGGRSEPYLDYELELDRA